MSVVKSSNSSVNSNQHHCVSHWRKCVFRPRPSGLLVRKETKVLEGGEEGKAPRVKRECKASWVYLVDTANKALWEIKEGKDERVKKENHCKKAITNRDICNWWDYSSITL